MPESPPLRVDTHILIKLKRYEKPSASYFENLALEVGRRIVESGALACHGVEYLASTDENESQETFA